MRNYTGLEYIKAQMKLLDYPVWALHPVDKPADKMSFQENENTPVDVSIELLEQAFINLSGDAMLKLRKMKPTSGGKSSDILTFYVRLKGTENSSIGNINTSTVTSNDSITMEMMKKNMELELELHKLIHAQNENKDLEKQKLSLQQEMLKTVKEFMFMAKASTPKAPATQSIGNHNQIRTMSEAHNSNHDNAPTQEQITEIRDRINGALKRIGATGINVVDTLEKLADMADRDPEKLKGLVSML